jgi:hypothetical protein
MAVLYGVPASPEFDSGKVTRDGRKLDIWHLFQFICQGNGLRYFFFGSTFLNKNL